MFIYSIINYLLQFCNPHRLFRPYDIKTHLPNVTSPIPIPLFFINGLSIMDWAFIMDRKGFYRAGEYVTSNVCDLPHFIVTLPLYISYCDLASLTPMPAMTVISCLYQI